MSNRILIVDDEDDIRHLIQGILEDEGYKISQAANAVQAYEQVETDLPELVILDIWLQESEHDGLQILANIKEKYPHLPIIMISGHGTIETAVAAIKEGAYDFIEKPFKSDRLILMAQRALETAALRRENEALKRSVKPTASLVGTSSAFQELNQLIGRIAPTNSRVLLTGEPGSGKDLVAKTIHERSSRSFYPFLVLNCATLRPENLETELFGSSAKDAQGEDKVGVLEQANGGTLLLDEVANMPLETQAKVLRALQEQRFQKPGSSNEIEVDVRILASTNTNLEEAVREGLFREDLYYRLNVVPLEIPSLRVRAQDIPLLINHFLQELAGTKTELSHSFSKEALSRLQAYHWPGNVRQLRNVIEWILIMKGGEEKDIFQIEDLPPEVSGLIREKGEKSLTASSPDFTLLSLREARERFEKEYLKSQIGRFEGNVSKTAQFIGMDRSALHRKLKSLQILMLDKNETQKNQQENKQKRA